MFAVFVNLFAGGPYGEEERAGWIYRDRIIPTLEKMRWLILPVFVLWKLAEIYS